MKIVTKRVTIRGRARQITWTNGKFARNAAWSSTGIKNAEVTAAYKKRHSQDTEDLYSKKPEPRQFRVHIRMEYSVRKDRSRNIDYEAQVVVSADSEREAREKALGQFQDFLISEGYPLMTKWTAIMDTQKTLGGSGYVAVRGRKIGGQHGESWY